MSIPNMYSTDKINFNNIKKNITDFIMKVVIQKPRKK